MVLDKEGFNRWAAQYDQTVAQTQADSQYPFAGYDAVLQAIETIVAAKPQPEVLDAGFGTGVLTRRLAERGARITGFDFALAMVETVRRQLPQAELFVHDFNDGWPAVLAEKQFDFIVSTYALHHLSVAGQIAWIQEMLSRLKPGGRVLIGDVAFDNAAALHACRDQAGERWDAEEIYLTREQLEPVFAQQLQWQRCSFCAALMSFGAD